MITACIWHQRGELRDVIVMVRLSRHKCREFLASSHYPYLEFLGSSHGNPICSYNVQMPLSMYLSVYMYLIVYIPFQIVRPDTIIKDCYARGTDCHTRGTETRIRITTLSTLDYDRDSLATTFDDIDSRHDFAEPCQ